MAYSRDSSEDLRWDSSTGQYVTNSVSNPVFYIYPYGVEFTATYSGTGTTFNQNDCTVETDGNNIKHYTYSITTTEPGTLSVASYGNNYSLIVNDSAAHYDLTITVTKPSKLYSWSRKFYAWTNSDTGSDITFWTLNENPTVAEFVYDRAGDDVTTSYLDGTDAKISTVSSSTITLLYADVGFNLPVSAVANNTGAYAYNRDSSRDFLGCENLYAWKDPNHSNSRTIYTRVEVPSGVIKVYDATGLDITNEYVYNDTVQGKNYFLKYEGASDPTRLEWWNDDEIQGLMREAYFNRYSSSDLLPNKMLYAWTIESGSSVSPSEAVTFYTKTPNPVFDPNNDIYPELFDADGNSYGTGRSALMSWILTKNGSSRSETYFQQVSSSSITLRAIGPA